MTAPSAPLNYDFVTPRKIVFGWGRRSEVGRLAAALGHRVFIVPGAAALVEQDVIGQVTQCLADVNVEAVVLETISREPEVDDVDRLAADVVRLGTGPGDVLIGVGGGSAIDMAKALAAMATNRQSNTVQDYLENVGRDLKLAEPPLPVVAMPTTSGTGAEATRNAVISSYAPPFKKSLRDEQLVPQVALVDPELAVSMPAAVTAATGMDAITQLIESYISRKARPIPRAICVEGLKLALPAIAEAVAHPTSRWAREGMAHAALLSGMALANSGLGMAHGVAAALGVHAHVPHGAACALMLPMALKVNSETCRDDLAGLARGLFTEAALLSDKAAAGLLIERVDALCVEVGVPRRLSDVGVSAAQIPAIVASSRGSSMSGNPLDLSDRELTVVLEQLL